MTFRSDIAGDVAYAIQPDISAAHFHDDPNLPFSPPADAPWARLSFQDGAEAQASFGGVASLWRRPVLVYVDLFLPLGIGDGLAGEIASRVEDALRRKRYDDGRWLRFEQGPEGVSDDDYRKQVVAVFRRDRRV